MQLIHCHIENFGRLSRWDCDFKEGIHILREDNGWGKSTLAAFLCVMFYGLAGDRKRKNPEENERRKYAPWQGGVFGGSLTFTSGERCYVLTRTFGRTSEKEDTCELRDADTNRIQNTDSLSPGEYFFHIGRESFRGTVFLGQNNCRAVAGDDIHALIGNISDDTGDLNRYEDAMNRLTRSMTALRAGRGSNGSLDRRQRHMEELTHRIREAGDVAAELVHSEAQLEEEEARIRDLEARRKGALDLQARVAAAREAQACYENHRNLRETLDRKHREILEKRSEFPGSIPSVEDITAQIHCCTRMNQAAAQYDSYCLNPDQESFLEDCRHRFDPEPPSEEDLQRMLQQDREVYELRMRHASSLLSPAEEERCRELELVYGSEGDETPSMMARWNERTAREATLPGRRVLMNEMQASAPSTDSLFYLIPGAALLLVGILIFLLSSRLPGIAAAVSGCLLLGYGIFVHGQHSSAPSSEAAAMAAAIQQDEAMIARIDSEISSYLERHGRNFTPDAVPVLLQSIYEEYHEYLNLAGRRARSGNLFSTAKTDRMEQDIRSYLDRFDCPSEGTTTDRLHQLRADALQYRQLTAVRSHAERSMESCRKWKEQILHFLRDLEIVPRDDLQMQLLALRDAADDYFDTLRELQAAETALREFEEEHPETEEPQEDLPSLSDIARYIRRIDDDLSGCRIRRSELRRRIGELRSACDDLEEKKAELTELQSLQMKEQEQYRLLSLTRDSLSRARDTLTSRYSDPVLTAFRSYVGTITDIPADHYHLDADTSITVDQLGMQRSLDSFSSGTRDLLGFALRIALVDAMYDAERPPLILDDPFVNLDDSRLAGAKDLLRQIAEHYQIIYFTCSDARC